MKLFQFENYGVVHNQFDKKKLRKELQNGINGIVNSYTLDMIYDYKITNFILQVGLEHIEVSIFGYGKPDLESDSKKQDALVKLIFDKNKKNWSVKYKKSHLYKEIETIDTEVKSEKIFEMIDRIIKFLNK